MFPSNGPRPPRSQPTGPERGTRSPGPWRHAALSVLLLTACAHLPGAATFEFGTHRLGRLRCTPDATSAWSCTSEPIDVVALAQALRPGERIRKVVVVRASFMVNRDDPPADSSNNLPSATVEARIALRPADAPADGSRDLLLGTLHDIVLRRHQVFMHGQVSPSRPIEPLGPVRIVASGKVSGPAENLYVDVFCEATAMASR